MRCIAAIAALMACTAWGAGSPVVQGFVVPAKTSVPFTYCIWYLQDPEKASFLEELRASPPDLFHLGYQIPFKGALGPTYGHELFTDAILPPDQIPREIERIKRGIAQMRAAGVPRLIPYVYSMAFFGDPEKRTGFFHFFDHWDEYRPFGLGPKPAADPTLWVQTPGPEPLGSAPEGVLHYQPCVNQPAWREYLDLVARQLAGVGYDGMFFDVNTEYCYCPHCQEQFDVYLLRKYGRAGLRDAFGTDDARVLNIPSIYRDFEDVILRAFKEHLQAIWQQEHLAETLGAASPSEVKLEEDWRLLRCYMQESPGEYPASDDFDRHLRERFGATRAGDVSGERRSDFIQTVLRHRFLAFLKSPELAALLQQRFGSSDIRRRCRGNPRDLLLWVEAQCFWCDSMASLFARLKEDGRTAFADQGRTDDFYTVANLGSMVTVDGLNKRRVDGIDLVRWARMADMQMFEEMPQPGTLESGVILSNIFAFRWAMAAGTRAGTLLYQAVDDRAADLAEAEAAAGGGGAFIQPRLFAPESRQRWKRFFAEHADLWEGGASYARVGVLFLNDQVFYEYPEHLAMVHRWVQVLSETQTPFDLVTEEGLNTVGRYDVVIAPMLRYMDAEQKKSLIAYADNGGNLVIVEPFGTEDKWCRTQTGDAIPEQHGRGRIVRLGADAVPRRESDLWRLMEERAGTFERAQEYLDAARRKDVADGVDLGPKFIDRIEGALKTRLRWCPPGTDATVYLHAYHLLPQKGPERIVVHVVNYGVPILVEKTSEKAGDPMGNVATRSGEPRVANGVQVRVPLPPEKQVKEVRGLSPTDPVAEMRWSVEGSELTLAINQLHIYQGMVIDLSER